MSAILRDLPPRLRTIETVSIESFPILVTANWCPFTLNARNIWTEAAEACGRALRVVDAGSEDGDRLMMSAGVRGVPCLIAGPGRHMYGIHVSPAEARSFLQTPKT